MRTSTLKQHDDPSKKEANTETKHDERRDTLSRVTTEEVIHEKKNALKPKTHASEQPRQVMTREGNGLTFPPDTDIGEFLSQVGWNKSQDRRLDITLG